MSGQKTTEKHACYISNPVSLIDILDYVLKKYSQIKIPQIEEDKVIQYNEISKTIERLKESGASVPDDLRRIKLSLSHDAELYEKSTQQRNEALEILKLLELRVANSLTEIRSSISRLSTCSTQLPKSKRYVKRTSPTLLAKEIRKALREMGGSGKKADVLKRIQANMDGKFKPQDLERDNQGVLNWERWVVAEKAKMVKDGTLKTGTTYGLWELRRK